MRRQRAEQSHVIPVGAGQRSSPQLEAILKPARKDRAPLTAGRHGPATHSVAVLLHHIVGSRGVVVDVHRVFVVLTVARREENIKCSSKV